MSDRIPVLTFRLGEQDYALQIADVVEVAAIVELMQVAGMPDAILGIANRHGTPLPIIDLRRIFTKTIPTVDSNTLFIVVQAGERKAGLVVDEVYQVDYTASDQLQTSHTAGKLIHSIMSNRGNLAQVIAVSPLLDTYLNEQIASFEADSP